MNRDLYLAILSMDSYNRGYGQGVVLNPGDSPTNQSEAGRRLGNATILNVDLPAGSVTAGFYAIAYDWNGETVISYRGTDGNYITDILNGWFAGGGFYIQPQARLAVEFYKSVVGVDGDGYFTANPFTSNITLTGHSLGRALAANDNRPRPERCAA